MKDNVVLGNSNCSTLSITAAMKLERNDSDDTNYDDGRSFNSSLCPSPSPPSEGTDDLIELEDDFIDQLGLVDEIEVAGSSSSTSSSRENNQTSMEIVPSFGNDQSFSSDNDGQDNYDTNLETNATMI